MASSRAIASKARESDDRLSLIRGRLGSSSSQDHTASSRGSTSQASSRASKTATRDRSRQFQASSRGRKPYELSEEVDRSLVNIIGSTDVSFDTLAQAFEEAGGPRKLWLRRRFEQIAGTKCFGFLRLRNERSVAEDRRQRQFMAKEMAEQLRSGSESRSYDPGSSDSDLPRVPPTGTSTPWTSRRRPSHLGGMQNDSTTLSQTIGNGPRSTSISTSPTRKKASEGRKDSTSTDYVARGNRARALSISSITRRLEQLTGNTGLYEHIRRNSINSHLSPLFRSVRWSRGSKATSGCISNAFDQASPIDISQIIYVPDPDFEEYYHQPTAERIERAEVFGASAVAILMSAKASSQSDESAQRRLESRLPGDAEARQSYLDQADENSVTALHLAVAYGWPHVCVLLMQNKINHRAVTRRKSSVCRFAKPAQELAGADISLYNRILHARQWVCAGLPPRLATDGEAQTSRPSNTDLGPRISKRRKTNETISVLYTVDEAGLDEAMSDDANETLTATATNTTNHLPPLVTNWDFNNSSAAGPSDNRYSTPLGIFYEPEGSLDPSFWQKCPHDHPNIAAMLTPDSVPRSAVSWSGEVTSPVSQIRPPSFPTISMMAEGQGFAGQPQSLPFSSAGEFGTVTSDASTLNVPSSFWPADSSMMEFPSAAMELDRSMDPTETLIDDNKQHVRQLLPTSNDNITSNYPSSTQYFAPQHYNLAPTSMHHYTSQPLYLTPPDEPGGWPAQLQNTHGWTETEVYQATARALAAQQEHSGVAFAPEWGGEDGLEGMENGLYYEDDTMNGFGRQRR